MTAGRHWLSLSARPPWAPRTGRSPWAPWTGHLRPGTAGTCPTTRGNGVRVRLSLKIMSVFMNCKLRLLR